MKLYTLKEWFRVPRSSAWAASNLLKNYTQYRLNLNRRPKTCELFHCKLRHENIILIIGIKGFTECRGRYFSFVHDWKTNEFANFFTSKFKETQRCVWLHSKLNPYIYFIEVCSTKILQENLSIFTRIRTDWRK